MKKKEQIKILYENFCDMMAINGELANQLHVLQEEKDSVEEHNNILIKRVNQLAKSKKDIESEMYKLRSYGLDLVIKVESQRDRVENAEKMRDSYKETLRYQVDEALKYENRSVLLCFVIACILFFGGWAYVNLHARYYDLLENQSQPVVETVNPC